MLKTNRRLRKKFSRIGVKRLVSTLPYEEKVHLRARAIFHMVLGRLGLDEWFAACGNSSGTSLGVPYSDTSNDRKFTFPMTCTEGVITLFEACMRYNSQLYRAIEDFNSLNPIGSTYCLEEGSRATTVDKTDTKRRMICVEPTVNMYLQQGLMQLMYRKMSAFGLDVETLPSMHKLRARWSSVTGLEATIDWSSASDCVSIELLRWLLPPSWFEAVIKVRSPKAKILGQYVDMHMISTMGNAVTFPLETLVFWAYGHAVRLSKQTTNTLFPEWKDRLAVSVFGDDCIVESVIANDFVEVMTDVGFIINSEKSCIGPMPFRESCGGDYLHGFNVRPYFLKAPPNTRKSSLEPWLYTVMNGLIKRYISYFGDLSYVYDKELFRLFSLLFSRYKLKLKLVPDFYPDDSGLKYMSQDIVRFANLYTFQLERITRSHQGTYTFNYCRFRYLQRVDRDQQLRYVLWLQKPVVQTPWSLNEPQDTYPIRKKGGYVVAKGVTGHWSVSDVKSVA